MSQTAVQLRTVAAISIVLIVAGFAGGYLTGTSVAPPTTLGPPQPAEPTKLVLISLYNEPHEVEYFESLLADFESAHPNIETEHLAVDFEALFTQIQTMHLANEDADVIFLNAIWLPEFVKAGILAEAPVDFQQYIRTNWEPVAVEGSTWDGKVWGLPTELNNWMLVYNKALLAQVGIETPPQTWEELRDAARRLSALKVVVEGQESPVTGYWPYTDTGSYEENTETFVTWLWSNGGEWIDWGARKAIFNSNQALEVLQFWWELCWVDHVCNPEAPPDIWWDAWDRETIGMMTMASWWAYLRDTQGFANLGVAPAPVGPSGERPYSLGFSWLAAVSARAVTEGRSDEAFLLLRWLGTPEGPVVSRMGDRLVDDGIPPSKISDRENHPTLKVDFWFGGFIEGASTYGRTITYFPKLDEVLRITNEVIERVVILGERPTMAMLNDAVARINAILAEA